MVRALLRRLSSLCYFHCGCELKVDFKGLIEQASMIQTVRSELHWHEQERFSTRQRQRIEIGGVLGRVEFEAPEAATWAPYLPLLAAGEWVHVGKRNGDGAGEVRVGTVRRVFLAGRTEPRGGLEAMPKEEEAFLIVRKSRRQAGYVAQGAARIQGRVDHPHVWWRRRPECKRPGAFQFGRRLFEATGVLVEGDPRHPLPNGSGKLRAAQTGKYGVQQSERAG